MNQDGKRNNTINKIVQMVDNSEIASIKQVVSGIIEVIEDPESTAKDLKDMIGLDPPLTGKILRVANSAYYAVQRQVNSIEQAAILIGFDAIKELALSLKVCEFFASGDSTGDYSRSSLWKHSVAVGLLGRMIYRREFRKRGENIYIAGLLHEIGIIAEDQFLHEEFKKILDTAKIEKTNLTQAEHEMLGFNHAELGKAITDNWNLPQKIIMGIGYHHNPTQVPPEFSKIALTLFIADTLCQQREVGYCDAPFEDQAVFQQCLTMLNLNPYSLDLIMEGMEQEFLKLENQGLFL